MPGPKKPPHIPDKATREPGSLAAAATGMMWAISLATTRTAVASTARSIEFWSQMLRVAPPAWPLLGNPFGRGLSTTATPGATPEQPVDVAPAEPIKFASYRSSSGHAAAQVSRQH